VQEFLIGKPAADILISYHALQHFKFLMHQKCQEEVSNASCCLLLSLFSSFHILLSTVGDLLRVSVIVCSVFACNTGWSFPHESWLASSLVAAKIVRDMIGSKRLCGQTRGILEPQLIF